MPIIVACPKCATKLSAPDNAAGKQVRCPRPGCGAVAEVPAFLSVQEVEVIDAVPAPPKLKSIRADDEDDDRPRKRSRRRDDDDDEFDRRRRRRRAKSGTSAGAVIAIVLGSLVLLAGLGVGIYALASKKKDDTAKQDASGGNTGAGLHMGPSRPKASVPAGWVLHTLPGKFQAYFPKSPLITTTDVSSLPGMPLDMAMVGGPRERLAVIVYAMPIPPQAAANRDQIAEQIRFGILQKQGKSKVLSERSLTWSGRKALEMTIESSNKKATVTYRQIVTDKCMYLAFFACSTGPSPDEENGFFDNFEVLE